MINFPKSITIEACEKFINKLNCNSDALQLPVDTTAPAFGGLASAIQAVNTWARVSSASRLELRNSKTIDVISDVIVRPHKFSASMMARSIVLDNTPTQEIRSQINYLAKQAIEMQSQHQHGQQYGRLCWFSFVDHSSKAFDPNFYIKENSSKPTLRQPEQFKAIIKAMAEKAISISGGAKAPVDDDLDHLGRIFYELFLNTHEHGSRGEARSEWLKPGMRIIYAQGINLTEAGEKGITQQQPVLSEYVASLEEKLGIQGNRRFLELAIVDSGLGYCGRWLADNPLDGPTGGLSLQDEYGIFKKCFNFRNTSTSRNNKGNGLPVVMDRLTKLNGFMRVRSGRLSLYRDFVASPQAQDNACEFFDWSTQSIANESISEMSKAAGVAISLLIPLEAKE
ncbi:hypothetical protein [Denitrificimonas caeni]|uniref:hypothetical protein n=1 Tax=Denitrificimonas caeni TaxID=521720 RepID=UPI0019652279|nr:hypothetical protein [Denitrificimonas caeni]